MARKKTKLEIENLLTELYNRIEKHYELDEILLFGSYAKGTANEWSDDLDLQLTAFSSKSFYQDTTDQGFIEEIKRTSKKIYSKETGLNFSQL